jgi:hypothetical protein
MTERLTTADWDRLLEELREFAGEGNVSVEDGAAHAKTGDGHVELSREGWIRTGMPLHGFEADGDVELTFDHERGHLHVRVGDVEYTFRRP